MYDVGREYVNLRHSPMKIIILYCLTIIIIVVFYLVGDHFRVEFETFGDVEFAERGTELTHHFQFGPHVAAWEFGRVLR